MIKKQPIDYKKCYLCGQIFEGYKNTKIFCSKECYKRGDRCYSSECFAFNNSIDPTKKEIDAFLKKV